MLGRLVATRSQSGILGQEPCGTQSCNGNPQPRGAEVPAGGYGAPR